jgi:hypothetical protein
MNDVSDTDITKQAIRAIGDDDPNADYILRPEEHALKLPPEAGPLARILQDSSYVEAGKAYRDNDGAAQWAQARFKRAGRIALGAALGATLVGAILLALPTREFHAAFRLSGAAFEYTLLLVAFIAEIYNTRANPFLEWMTYRGRAEIDRLKLFDSVFKAKADVHANEIPLLPLKLEYFRRYQFEVQRRYYRQRGAEHEHAARRIRRLQKASFVIAAMVGALGLMDSLSLLEVEQLRAAASFYHGLTQLLATFKIDSDRTLVALGAAASAIYGFAAALSLLSLHARNAARYKNTCDNLDLLAEQLDSARAAACAGNAVEVDRFVDRAQAFISSEHQEWVRWRDWPPQPDARAVYIVVPK